ncbi:MAG: alanine racemase [Candidatus Taylorbacteria bacterium RIFCSPHIGHO2_01_FULL_46_22b]|uniref:Alanine racemase n=1 Tax=Candidatus Taylorbacteria bacterium RIFCSPHIGHO2_01_FULL_46_22b TaxID=1802301 RepID=A0A1G2M431_9BACT|nr:MAG: alanine racemase [Candidatus Taylorbacteria bacterium RIFCSPHIGHO2_01_FULL_46_22b]
MKDREQRGFRTWVEINKDAIRANYRTFRSLLRPEVKFMAVVKSNAYGHGMVEYAKELDSLGADWLGVDELSEAITLRKAGIKKPILVLGFTSPEGFVLASENDISVTISNFTSLNAVSTLKTKLPKIHIKIDTGLHRQGFLLPELPDVLSSLLASRSPLAVEGLYTHFAAAESPSSPYSLEQINQFKLCRDQFMQAGFSLIAHTAGTAATMLLPESHFDMVRVGIGLYGLWPSSEVKQYAEKRIALDPVLSWKAIVGDVKSLKCGDKIGYDLTETVSRDSRVAICGIGYWHGFFRSLSSKGIVGIHGKPAKVLGRVSMDMIVLDVTDIPEVQTGDEVVIIGNSEKNNFSAEVLAETAGTINYEIVTRINPLIPRIYA